MSTPFRLGTFALLLATCGCGGGTADVSGKVTFKGKPVTYGTVMILGPSGVPVSGAINPDGTFTVRGVSRGAAKVAVSSPRPPGAPDAAARPKPGGRDAEDEDKIPRPQTAVDPAAAAGWMLLPERYGDPAKSELTHDVQPGKPLDIDLK